MEKGRQEKLDKQLHFSFLRLDTTEKWNNKIRRDVNIFPNNLHSCIKASTDIMFNDNLVRFWSLIEIISH